jgi:hypothetical protein
MKNITTLILLLFSIVLYCQNEKKEIVYLLFDAQSKEKCQVPVEGKGHQKLNKFRKEAQGEYIYFKICDESFSTHKTKSLKDTCSITYLEEIELVDLNYLIKKYNSENEFKHHVFDKIFFVEKISKDVVVKYQVTWVDEIIMIDD